MVAVYTVGVTVCFLLSPFASSFKFTLCLVSFLGDLYTAKLHVGLLSTVLVLSYLRDSIAWVDTGCQYGSLVLAPYQFNVYPRNPYAS